MLMCFPTIIFDQGDKLLSHRDVIYSYLPLAPLNVQKASKRQTTIRWMNSRKTMSDVN